VVAISVLSVDPFKTEAVSVASTELTPEYSRTTVETCVVCACAFVVIVTAAGAALYVRSVVIHKVRLRGGVDQRLCDQRLLVFIAFGIGNSGDAAVHVRSCIHQNTMTIVLPAATGLLKVVVKLSPEPHGETVEPAVCTN
jgi:hypothetical protein